MWLLCKTSSQGCEAEVKREKKNGTLVHNGLMYSIGEFEKMSWPSTILRISYMHSFTIILT